MVYDTLYKSFAKYVDEDDCHLTEKQQRAALESFEKPFNKRVFQVSIILMLWSIVGLTIDSFIIGGSATAAVVNGPAWIQLLPTLIFSAVNWIIKCIFVYFYLQRKIPFYIAFITGVQYIGFTLLLAYTLKNDPEFRHGLHDYIKYLKKKGIRFVINMMSKKKKTS